MDGSSVSPVFPTKADLDEIRLEYVAVFIVIIILIVLALILVCVGLGCIFCTRRNSLSKKKDHERDTELSEKLSHGQVTLRSLSGKKEHTHAAAASKAKEAPAKQQRTTQPPEYEYPMHLFHEEVSEETVVS